MAGNKLKKKRPDGSSQSKSTRERANCIWSLSTRIRVRLARFLSRRSSVLIQARKSVSLDAVPQSLSALSLDDPQNREVLQDSTIISARAPDSDNGNDQHGRGYHATSNDQDEILSGKEGGSNSGTKTLSVSGDIPSVWDSTHRQLTEIGVQSYNEQFPEAAGENQSSDEEESVWSFDENDLDQSMIVLRDTSRMILEGPSRQSVVRSDSAVLGYIDISDQESAYRVAVSYAPPVLASINELRSHVTVSDFGELSYPPENSLTDSSRLSSVTDEMITEIDDVIELYNSPLPVSGSDLPLEEMTSGDSSGECLESVDMSRFSTIERMLDPSIVLTGLHAQLSRVASKVGSNRRYPALAPPGRLYCQFTAPVNLPNQSCIGPLDSAANEEKTDMGKDLDMLPDEIPPPIPERSPARPRAPISTLRVACPTARMSRLFSESAKK